MSTNFSRLAALAAATIFAVGVAAWLGRPGSLPGGSPAMTPPVTSDTRPDPTAVTIATDSGVGFGPGAHVIGPPFEFDVTVTFPTSGWTVWGRSIASKVAPYYKISPDPPGLGLILGRVENVYANACKTSDRLLDPPLGTSVDDLVTALTQQPFTDATEATDVTISGYSGKHVAYTFTAGSSDCPTLARWPTQIGDRQAIASEHDEVWILDVDGRRLVIDLFSFATTSSAEVEQARRMVETMIIAP